jgi:Zn-dependent protease
MPYVRFAREELRDALAIPGYRPPMPPAAKPDIASPYIGPAILAGWIGLGTALSQSPASGPLMFAFVMVGWILAVMAHEFAHALTAWLAGDHTVVARGYLTFDPRLYGDLTTSLLIPLLALALGGVGFPGGAVWLRQDLMRSRLWRSAASLAGPAATLLVLLALAAILGVWKNFDATGPLYPALTVLAYLQATALILNLLPIPGLDGFGAIRPFLPRAWGPTIHRFEGLAVIGLLAVLLAVPGAGGALFRLAADLGVRLGLEPHALQWGWQAFRFWA